ncbi:MAG: hypothetical protein HY080_09420 [Gammaproteobacteria bacterium]|nr:hypothetical protein [Gammaproteobacteria bacterium]
MRNKTICTLIILVLNAVACAQSPPSGVYRIYEYCRKEKTDPTVVSLVKKLGLDAESGGGGYFKFYQPRSRTDYDYIHVTMNPQPTLNDIQGMSITWKKPGLTYEEIQQLVGLALPLRGSKEIYSEKGGFQARYHVADYKYNAGSPALSDIVVICEKNSYDACTQIDIHCFEFVHPD